VVELRWASAFALTRWGITGPSVVDALIEVVARPPERAGTMSFLSGSYCALAAMALAGTSEGTTLRAVEAVLAGLAGCTGLEAFHDRYYTARTLLSLVFPDAPAEPPQSFNELSEAQQRVVRFLAESEEGGRPSMDALRRWKVPTGRPELRAYAGLIDATYPDSQEA